jgi:hypothetical protein
MLIALLSVVNTAQLLRLYYKQRVKAYKAVNYNAYKEALKDYLLINLRAA